MVTLPIKTVVRPSSLAGLNNGFLPSSVLSRIDVGNAVMEKTAARAFKALFASARALGIQVKEVGDYRSFSEQLALFISRYNPVSLATYQATPTAHRKYWSQAYKHGFNSLYWVKKSFGLATAAVPGSSNHGWGLALDIAEETDGDPGPEGITSRFVNWLVENADHYGICAELQSEVWHWRYYRGDNIPGVVLAYEQGQAPPSPIIVTPPSTGAITVDVTTITLRNGSTGPEVRRLQQMLNELAGQGLVADGNFGPKTEAAVKSWQSFFGLLADGVVGSQTWKSLIEVWLKAAK